MFCLSGNSSLSLISFSFAGAILAFLFYNWEPSKVFMGDTGALTIGFLVAFICIEFINANYQLAPGPYKFQATIATPICVIIIPLFDTLRVFITRVIRKQSPFRPDKTHIHHLLMRLGLSHASTVLIILVVNIAFISLAILGRKMGDELILSLMIALALVFSFTLDLAVSRKFNKKLNGKKLNTRTEEAGI